MLRYFKTITRKDGYGNAREEQIVNTPVVVKDIILVVVGLIVLTWVWPFYSVPTGSRGVVTQFGRILRIEPEGLAILPPWQRLALFSIRSEAAHIDKAIGATADIQPVDTSLTVRYSIRPDKVAEVYEKYSHDGDLSSYVQTATQEIFKAVTARYVATDIISKRPQVSNDIYDALQSKLDKYGAQVINIDMRNFEFSPQYMAAINSKVTQEQLRLAAENQLKTVEAQQKQKVAIAEAEASAVVARAHGNADAVRLAADAEQYRLTAESKGYVARVQAFGSAATYVDFVRAQTWKGDVPQYVGGNGMIPFLNMGK